jgi:hypothetical protein
MRNDLATDHSNERYVVEVDGIAKAEYPIFVKALKAGLQLRGKSFRIAASNCATLTTKPLNKLRRCRPRDTIANAIVVHCDLPSSIQVSRTWHHADRQAT